MTEPMAATRTPRRLAMMAANIVAALVWHGAGLWVALATHFTAPGPRWLATLLAVGIGALFVVAWRRRTRAWLVVAVVLALVAVSHHVFFVTPTHDLEWEVDQAVMPEIEIDGSRVTVRNARRFVWRSIDDFTPGYYDAALDADQITGMYYVIAPFSKFGALAHVFMSFSFADGQHISVSVEARRTRGQPFRPIASMFRQHHLIYIIGDERDVVGLRGVSSSHPVQFYPARSTPQRMRDTFLDMMRRADDLERQPEFYHLIASNCMNNLLYHLRYAGVEGLPSQVWLLLTGFSDRVAHDLGFLDTDLPFHEARAKFRIDDRIREHIANEDFSRRIRIAD